MDIVEGGKKGGREGSKAGGKEGGEERNRRKGEKRKEGSESDVKLIFYCHGKYRQEDSMKLSHHPIFMIIDRICPWVQMIDHGCSQSFLLIRHLFRRHYCTDKELCNLQKWQDILVISITTNTEI